VKERKESEENEVKWSFPIEAFEGESRCQIKNSIFILLAGTATEAFTSHCGPRTTLRRHGFLPRSQQSEASSQHSSVQLWPGVAVFFFFFGVKTAAYWLNLGH
jgi:hypothetical protein